MRKKRFLALLAALAMIFSILPGVSFAAEGESTNLLESYISTTVSTGTYAMDGFTNRPYAVSWSNADGYRMGVVAFSAEGLNASTERATLKLKVSRTQNVNESGSTSYVSVYAMDPAKVDNTNNAKPDAPSAATKVGTISMAGLPTQNSTITANNDVSGEIDLKKYFELYPNAETIALLLTNRDDIADCNSRGLVGFYGKGDSGNEPQLIPTLSTSVTVDLTVGGEVFASSEVNDLVTGQSFTPDSSVAPVYLISGDKIYTRGAVPTVSVTVDAVVQVPYTEEELNFSASVIEGDEPMLPSAFGIAKDKKLSSVQAEWSNVGGSCTAAIPGYSGAPLTAEIEVLSCDHNIETFYTAGNSDGAQFANGNKLGYVYGGGNVIFDLTFTVTEGTNKLFSYGNDTTAAFGDTGPIMRYANNGYFEYYDGSWKSSPVPCVTGKTYRLRTLADVTNKTYQMFVTDENGVTTEITNGPAAFRNNSLDHLTKMYHHGAGYTAGEGSDDMISHRAHWSDGWTEITVNHTANGGPILDQVITKATTGKTFTYTDVQKVVVKDGKTYTLPNLNTVPTLENVDKDHNVLDVEYIEAIVKPQIPAISTVVGQAPVMPSRIDVKFGEDQSMTYGVTWDISEVDVNSAGDYTANGHITDLNYDIKAPVHVKALIPDDHAELDKVSIATNNGGWNWYVEPSGTHIQPGDELAKRYQGETEDINGKPVIYTSNGGYKFRHDRTYMGWVEDDGDIVVAQYDHETDEYKRVVIHEKLESDDHNNPAVVVLPDGRIMAVYSMHTNEPYMYFRVTKNPEDISEWNAEQFYHGTGANATYPTVFMVHDDEGTEGNDVIYIGWRGVNWMPTFAKFDMPDENGEFPIKSNGDGIQPRMEQTQFVNTTFGYSSWNNYADAPNAYTDGGATDNGRRPYTKYDYDFDRNLIYITFTASHPDNDIRNHIFYIYLNVDDQGLYTAKDNYLQPLPKENASEYKDQGAKGTSGQWGVVTAKLVDDYPELVVFNASEQTGEAFSPKNAKAERRGWTWDIIHNEKGEPCVVYVDITATPPGENGALPDWYLANQNDSTRRYHYYWYARWDSEAQQWVKTFLTYGGKWFHQNATQERCYSGGLTFDHNYPGNVIYLSIPTEGKYGNVHEIYRWESDDDGATWTKRQAITQDSPTPNARPNAIYNYKMDNDGSNAGPRLLWISGEYRYWMNYEYKTGVKTDFPGMITQDDPEMFADASLTIGGEEATNLPVGEATVHAKFNITNISIGDGKALLALAHYGSNGQLKGIATGEGIEEIPARSVPQTSVVGADVDKNRANGLSAMGEPEVIVEFDYEPEGGFAEGDSIKLFAWNMGIRYAMMPILYLPYEISTSGNRYLVREDFTYYGDDKLVLDMNEDTFGGWLAKGYSSSGAVAMNDGFYAAVTKAPFGNTGLHLYRVSGAGSGQGIMVSHKLPDTDGKDYTLEFTMRHIDEEQWRGTDNQGFTLSHGVPEHKGDTAHPSAFQYRFKSIDDGKSENGRGTYGMVRNTTSFDDGSETTVINDNIPLSRDFSDPDRYERITYSKGVGYYDKQEGVYIHDYNDTLYTGSLFRIKVNVHPESQIIDMSVFDGYRTAYYSTPYNTGADWEANPIDTITFSIGSEKKGEIYIDDFRMYLSEEGSAIRTVYVDPQGTAPLVLGREWTILPMADGSNVLFNAEGKAMDVSGQSTAVGAPVDVFAYNGGDNQRFYLEATEGGYLIRGKQSGIYLSVDGDDGKLVLAAKENATVFTITDTGNDASTAVLEIIEMIENGTYIPTMEAIYDDIDEEPAIDAELEFIEEV
ncbi:MAG: BNR-4 repeat-containing protein [Oscillospiraceae bacterium]|nr:BNR-4 repeat-containing protein [Oscillospiraceae bacterium]